MTSTFHDDQRGFSLLETIIAMAILGSGLLGLIGVFALGMSHLAGSSLSLVAREKAREAIESVHSARDTRVLTWDQLQNQANGGVFLDGAQPLKEAGVDGVVNTPDDAAANLEMSVTTGPDNILGTADDVKTPMTQFTRQIEISEITGTPDPNLRQLKVTISYKVGKMNRQYVVTTYVSSIS